MIRYRYWCVAAAALGGMIGCGSSEPETQDVQGFATACEPAYQLEVTKTAVPSIDQPWIWHIDKAADDSTLHLAVGETLQMGYSVSVEPTGVGDDHYRVSGDVSIYNPAPVSSKITEITDRIGTMTVQVDCDEPLPYVLPAGDTLSCTYAATLPDDQTTLNTVVVHTEGEVAGNHAQAVIDFAEATRSYVDECVWVQDSRQGQLGEVCATEGATTFLYAYPIGPYPTCGEYEFVNEAKCVTDTTRTEATAAVTVSVVIPCDEGCTRTPGYWKTHSEHGPAPYDDTWALLPDGADTAFFLSGQTFYEVLWTPPSGNAYYILARAWIAAELNILAGADGSAISAEYDEAETLFETYSPQEFAQLGKAERADAIHLAETLDDYDNGRLGPEKCD